MKIKKFKIVTAKVDFVKLEHKILKFWDDNLIFKKLRKKNSGGKKWSFLDGPITANNPMGVHHAWGRTLKDIFQRYHGMLGHELRYQNGFDCQGLWVEVEVEKELGFKTKRQIEDFGLEKFVNTCKERVRKYSSIQTEQSKRLGYWMDWDNSYFTMSDENNYTIWAFLKKLYNENKIYKGSDVVPWSGRSGTSYSQMEIIEGRKLVAHTAVFIRVPIIDKDNEYLLIWTTTPWTLTSNVAVAVNINMEYAKVKVADGSIYYLANNNLNFQRLEKQFKDKKNWIDGIPKLKTISQIFKERGGYEIVDKIMGKDMLGWKYKGPYDELYAQSQLGGYPFVNEKLKDISPISCHKVIDGGKDNIGNDIVVEGEGTGLVHIAPGCGAIDSKIAKKESLVSIAPLDDQSCYLEGFGELSGKCATDASTIKIVLSNLRKKGCLFFEEQYPHIYPHCWRSGDELVFRMVDEWYINMDWRDKIKNNVGDINWIPNWGHDREMEWLDNMGDWMISKKRFWGLALPIWVFEDDSFFVVGSYEELKELAVEGWDEFEGNSPHRPWIDKVKIRHPETGLIGKRIPDVGNPWLDAGIVPYSTLGYNKDRTYWNDWFPADFVVECFPGQFRNWFYSLLALSTVMEDKAPFKTLLGHALVKDEHGREMHKSWGNAIWFDEAAEKMGVDVMRWMYAKQNPEQNLLFGYSIADEVRKQLITLWNTYSFFITYANLDNFNIYKSVDENNFTKLDLWIRYKTDDFIKNSKKYYNSYQVYNLIKEAEELLDNISNWYIRRNRRRFWKSENDGDKNAAYHTLYFVLMDFIKIISPIIPFISEEIYSNLAIQQDNAEESIHLCSYPAISNFHNNEIIKEVDTIIRIVNLGRSARNKANIKIRQPLSELIIYGNKHVLEVAENNKKEILEELNIKFLKKFENEKNIIDYNIKPNFQILGQKYGESMGMINNYIKESNPDDLMSKINNNQAIQIKVGVDLIDIQPAELIIDEIPREGYSVSSSKGMRVGILENISFELKQEGMVRDLIRQVQNLRKDSGLKVEDRINVALHATKDLYDAINIHKSYFMNEVLGKNLIIDKHDKLSYNHSTKINGIETTISISPVI